MVKQGGEWRECDWNVALDYVAHGLKDIVRDHGGDAIAAFAAPSATLEELHLLAKLTRGLGSNNCDFRVRQADNSGDSKRLGTPWLGMKLAEIKDLDAALVIGSFLRKDHPLIAQRLRQAAKKWTKVSLLSVAGDDQLINLHEHVTVAPSKLAQALGQVVKAAAEIKNLSVPAGLESVLPSDQAKTIAASLIEGEKRAIFLGNVAQQNENASTLHALANLLAELTGARLGFLGEGANAVGGYVAKAVSATGVAQLLDHPRKAYVLLHLEPELDMADAAATIKALKQASMVVSMSAFKHTPALDYADVILPVAPYTETSGTYVNIEGRIQSFNGVVKPLGDTRPAWKVLRVLGNVLNLDGFNQMSSEEVRDEALSGAVDFVEGLDNGLSDNSFKLDCAVEVQLQRIADVPIHFADSMARRAPALQQTADSRTPVAKASIVTLTNLGIADGQAVRVLQGQATAVLTASLDNNVPDGCVRVSAGHPATASLGSMFGSISLERA